jgi:YgiT-type zinc finger domain-containing protein
VICKHGELVAGLTTLTLERESATIVFKQVPARVCNTCGEEYDDEGASQQLLQTA